MAHNAPAQPSGAWEVTRGIKVPALRHAADAMQLTQALETSTGVHRAQAQVDKQRIVVRYDATQTDYRSIVCILEETGYPPTKNWWARMLASWYQFTDTNARDNANAPPPACCNKPPRQQK